MQIELELVGQASDAADADFEISNVQLKCDLVTLDNALDNQYAQHLLDGQNLPINFSTFTTASQIIANIDSSINVQRSFTRMKSVYVTLSNSTPVLNDDTVRRFEVKDFLHTMTIATNDYDFEKELQFQMQLGSKLFPEYPLRSLAEQYYQLRKLQGDYHTRKEAMDITPQRYRSDKFVIGIDTEKMLGAGFTGYNSKAGDLLTLRLNKANGNAALPAGGVTKMHYALEYDAILEITDTGVMIKE